MKIFLFLTVAVTSLAQGPGSTPTPVVVKHWTAAELTTLSETLRGKMPSKKGNSMIANQPLGNHGSFTMEVIRRDQSGDPEVHERWTDFMIVEEGEASILYGSKLEGSRETTPGEGRGGKIIGGDTMKLSRGDVVVMPAGLPHQLLIEKDQHFEYFVTKISNAAK